MARIESKRMMKGMSKWYKTVVHADTDYYNVVDFKDGSRLITFLADQEGRVFRVILSKEDIDRIFLGKTPIEAKKKEQKEKPIMLPPSNPKSSSVVDIQDLFPGQ